MTMPPKRQRLMLTLEHEARLRLLAPSFDIQFFQNSDGNFFLQVDQGPSTQLAPEIAHIRLLMEICSKCVKWVHFHLKESCRDTLLKRDSQQMARLIALYRLHQDKARSTAS